MDWVGEWVGGWQLESINFSGKDLPFPFVKCYATLEIGFMVRWPPFRHEMFILRAGQTKTIQQANGTALGDGGSTKL